MNFKKIVLHLIILIMATGIALIPTYYYGKIKRDRYYDGTILDVQKNQIKLMISILEQFKKDDVTINDLKKAFAPMKRFTIIKVRDKSNDETIIFKGNYYPVREENFKELKINDFTIIFGTYKGLEWHKQFIPWLKMILPINDKDIKKIQDGKGEKVYNWWHSYKTAYKRYDFITDPFIFFLFMSYIGIFLSVVVYTQHRYFKDISNTLEKLKRETVE